MAKKKESNLSIKKKKELVKLSQVVCFNYKGKWHFDLVALHLKKQKKKENIASHLKWFWI